MAEQGTVEQLSKYEDMRKCMSAKFKLIYHLVIHTVNNKEPRHIWQVSEWKELDCWLQKVEEIVWHSHHQAHIWKMCTGGEGVLKLSEHSPNRSAENTGAISTEISWITIIIIIIINWKG